MVYIDYCTWDGVMKVYEFNSIEQALIILEEIKNDDFQWFSLDWQGRRFTCPKKIINKMKRWEYINNFCRLK